MDSIINSSTTGIQNGMNRMNQAAQEIAQPTQAPEARDMVELNRAEEQTTASARALEAADKTVGSLIDIKV